MEAVHEGQGGSGELRISPVPSNFEETRRGESVLRANESNLRSKIGKERREQGGREGRGPKVGEKECLSIVEKVRSRGNFTGVENQGDS